MTEWTNDIFTEKVGDYKNCAILHMGCYRKDGGVDCRNCNIPVILPNAAKAILERKEMR